MTWGTRAAKAVKQSKRGKAVRDWDLCKTCERRWHPSEGPRQVGGIQCRAEQMARGARAQGLALVWRTETRAPSLCEKHVAALRAADLIKTLVTATREVIVPQGRASGRAWRPMPQEWTPFWARNFMIYQTKGIPPEEWPGLLRLTAEAIKDQGVPCDKWPEMFLP